MVQDFLERLIISYENTLQYIVGWVSDHLINVIIIFLIAYLIRRFGSIVIEKIVHKIVFSNNHYHNKLDKEKRASTLTGLFSGTLNVFVIIVAIILLIGEVSPNLKTALFTGAGLLSVAIGIGAKDLINDFINGIFIIIENQYRVGDVIQIAGLSGVVEDISIRTTVLRDLDGNRHHVPNGSIDTTSNMTLGFSRVNINIDVSYDTDIDKLESVVNEVGKELSEDETFKEKILSPPKFLRIDAFAKSSITIKIIADTTTGDQWDVKAELLRRIKKRFDKEKIEIPFPQVVVHQKQNKKNN
jgi:moderate conductance mechanosensitive channel